MLPRQEFPKDLVEILAVESWCGWGIGLEASSEPASHILECSGVYILVFSDLTLERCWGSLVKVCPSVKDIIDMDPELFQLVDLFRCKMAKTAVGSKDGLDI